MENKSDANELRFHLERWRKLEMNTNKISTLFETRLNDKNILEYKLQIVACNTLPACRVQFSPSTTMELPVDNFPTKITQYVSALKAIFAASPTVYAMAEFIPSLVLLEVQLLLWEHRSEHWWVNYWTWDFQKRHWINMWNVFYQLQVGSTTCNSDWLTIPCASDTGRAIQRGNSVCQDRLCGDAFASVVQATSGTVISSVRPFRVTVHFDGFEAIVPTSVTNVQAQFNNRGFCLSYIQQPCTF